MLEENGTVEEDRGYEGAEERGMEGFKGSRNGLRKEELQSSFRK